MHGGIDIITIISFHIVLFDISPPPTRLSSAGCSRQLLGSLIISLFFITPLLSLFCLPPGTPPCYDQLRNKQYARRLLCLLEHTAPPLWNTRKIFIESYLFLSFFLRLAFRCLRWAAVPFYWDVLCNTHTNIMNSGHICTYLCIEHTKKLHARLLWGNLVNI